MRDQLFHLLTSLELPNLIEGENVAPIQAFNMAGGTPEYQTTNNIKYLLNIK